MKNIQIQLSSPNYYVSVCIYVYIIQYVYDRKIDI